METIPWERMEHIGVFQAFWTTVKESLFFPSRFFWRLSLPSSSFMALLFALVMGSLQSLINALWSTAGATLHAQWPLLFGWTGQSQAVSAAPLIGCALFTFLEVVCITGLFHAGATLARLRRRDMGYTFRVACYANAAAAAEIIPAIGSLIAGVWFLIFLIRGLSAVHGNRVSPTFLAIAAPLTALGAVAMVIAIAAISLSVAAGAFFKDFSFLYR